MRDRRGIAILGVFELIGGLDKFSLMRDSNPNLARVAETSSQ